MDTGATRSLPPGAMAATYAGGFFSLSLLQMVALATPLWGGQIGLSVAMIGLVVGCRSITPMIYSIHFGAMMDAVGVRRVMLFFACLCVVLPLLYPVLPFAYTLIILQLLLGLASATVWLASQTAIARLAGGDNKYTSRFSFVAAAGTVVGPFLLGVAWDWGGAWAGYGLISVWGTLLLMASLMLPHRNVARYRRFSWRDLVPDIGAYMQAWRVLRLPVGAFIIACTSLRLASVSIQESFYPLLLQSFGYTSTAIGTLVAIGNLVSSPASLATGRWVRLMGSERRALIASVVVSIIAMTITPVLNGFWMFAGAIALYGFGLGVSMPLIFTLLSRGVPPDEQGVTAGLRATANRFASFVLPVGMGVAAAFLGVAYAFWAIGGLLLLTCLIVERLSKNRL